MLFILTQFDPFHSKENMEIKPPFIVPCDKSLHVERQSCSVQRMYYTSIIGKQSSACRGMKQISFKIRSKGSVLIHDDVGDKEKEEKCKKAGSFGITQ